MKYSNFVFSSSQKLKRGVKSGNTVTEWIVLITSLWDDIAIKNIK